MIANQDDSRTYYTVNGLIDSLGGYGRFQITWTIIMMFLPLTVCFVSTNTFSLQYLEVPESMDSEQIVSCVNESKFFQTENGTFEMVAEDMYSTATEEFGLYCDREIWIPIVAAVFFVGQAVGALTAGQISDNFGRRPALIVSELFLNVPALLSGFFDSFPFFVVCRFLSGAGYSACYIIVYSILFEMVPSEHVILLGLGYEAVFNLGTTLLAVAAFFIRDWRWLQLFVSVLALPSIFIPFWSPESLRWLVTSGKFKKAKQLAKRQAKANQIRSTKYDRIIDAIFYQKYQVMSERSDDSIGSWFFIVQILKMKKLQVWVLILALCWFVLSSAYFGIIGSIVPGKVRQLIVSMCCSHIHKISQK